MSGDPVQRNVLGGALERCSSEPLTGFYRDGCCRTGPEDLGSHTICAVVSDEFLKFQRSIGNDLSTPLPAYAFPGLEPGDRWCVTTHAWIGLSCYRTSADPALASVTRVISPIRRRETRPDRARP